MRTAENKVGRRIKGRDVYMETNGRGQPITISSPFHWYSKF